MKSGKPIDISKSSLVSLKAELARKQEEVKQVKGSESYIKLPPKPKEIVKTNVGVEDRNQRDLELLPEEVDLLKKSREVLEVKAKLYDKLQKGSVVSDSSKSTCLVDFSLKEQAGPGPSFAEANRPSTPSDEGKQSSDEDFDDSEWVEYKDCLGRTRTCHRSELAAMKERDNLLAKETERRREETEAEQEAVQRPPELQASDQEREEFRKKWEQQERELLNKGDIHYEDILFDEARAHGVGYFKFSRDEEERRKEQEMLKKVREETEARQREARLLRERREAQKQARLIAARQRQRARVGLPPLSEAEILADLTSKTEVKKEDEEAEEPRSSVEPSSEDLEETLKKTAYVRPWDQGKTPQAPVLSQEEYVETMRAKRIEEFAPSYEATAVTKKLKTRPFEPRSKVAPHRGVPEERAPLPSPHFPSDTGGRSSALTEAEIEARLNFIRSQVLEEKKQMDS